uniref:Pkinase_C domain-containing protein n=1 Tax=Macrostomum lignano TaxID=282301 RepID=A0A1I8FA60_9PLAT
MSLSCDLTEVTSRRSAGMFKALPKSEFRVHLAKPSSWNSIPAEGVAAAALPASPGTVCWCWTRFLGSSSATCCSKGRLRFTRPAIPHCRTSLFWRGPRSKPPEPTGNCEHHFLPAGGLRERHGDAALLTQSASPAPSCPGSRPARPAYPFSRRPQCPLQAAGRAAPPSTTTPGLARPEAGAVRESDRRDGALPLEQSCDQAVLVARGWNPDAGLDGSGGGGRAVCTPSSRDVGFSPPRCRLSTPTARIRRLADTRGREPARGRRMKRLCRTDYCVNNLVIYLRSPACWTATLLLWDFNNDYDVSRDEEYSPEELLADLSQCKARREFTRRSGGRPPLMYGVSETNSIFGNGLSDPVTAGCRSLPTSLIIKRMAARQRRRARDDEAEEADDL